MKISDLKIYRILNGKTIIYKNAPICDKRVFYLIDNFDCEYDEDNQTTIITNELISNNHKVIENKLKREGNNIYYKKLLEKHIELIEAEKEYDIINKILERRKKVNKLDMFDELERSMARTKLLFTLIELKVNLGISLEDIANEDIELYCAAINFDLVNNKYEPLSINKHFDEATGEINICKIK